MSQTPISEIREKYRKSQFGRIFVYILLSIIVVVALFSTQINYGDDIILALFLLVITVNVITPDISKYDLIRFHLNELITFLNEKNSKKSEHHIDKLALSINEFNNEIENSFLFRSTKSTLNNLWTLLKYNIFPCLKDNDYNRYITTLKEINNSVDNENLTNLNEIIDEDINDLIERGEQNTILFPYEKPNFLNQIYKSGKNKFLHFFRINFVFRFVCVASVVFIIGYFCSIKISSLNFDSTFIGALSIVSLGIAKEI